MRRLTTLLAFTLMMLMTLGASVFARPAFADDDNEDVEATIDEVPTEGQLLATAPDQTVKGVFPLRHTDVHASISGFLSRVTVTQQFENPYTDKIEAVYVFPLPQSAAVDRMTMKVGDRTITGKVAPRAEARAEYEAARDEGYAASLLEQERPNIFTQSVANILPGERIDITISYIEMLAYDDGTYTWVFPMVVAPRYIPTERKPAPVAAKPETERQNAKRAEKTGPPVPDAGRITPSLVPRGVRSGHDIAIQVELDSGVPLVDVKSVLHDVSVSRTGASSATVQLADEAVIPNRDFVMTFDVAGRTISDAVLAHADPRGGFFSLILQPPDSVPANDVTPKELVFVLDTSGSMGGFPIEKAKECIRMALDGLYPDDTFNLITFAGETSILFPAPVPATKENLARANAVLDGQQGGGGTEMMTAIRAALEPTDHQDHVRVVCFMTDGEVGNDMEIIGEVRKHPNARVFSFGIGDSVNRFLLEKIATEGRGEAQFVSLADDGSAAARRFHQRVRNPLLTDVRIDWGGLAVADVYPQRLPDLFGAQPVIVCGRYDRAGTGTIRLIGKSAGREVSRTIQVAFPESETANDSLASLWARMRIDATMAEDWEGLQSGTPRQDVEAEITRLGVRYGLMTQFTSFVAVDDSTSRGKDAAKRIDVPVELPEGMIREAVESAGIPEAIGAPVASATPAEVVAPSQPAEPVPVEPAAPQALAAGQASLSGTVDDSQGAVIPGATVTISDGNGGTRSVVTNNVGQYRFDGIPVGRFSIRVEAPGFSLFARDNVHVRNSGATLNATLEVGSSSETVEVIAGESGVQVNSSSQTLSTTVSHRKVRSLPMNARNP
ncbi:MAG TPA: VIT domain-containing protein, partial [Blastocatellia bacterium]|nr:VIT domain-containing protein [Blastocatellia bacterium]